MVRTNYGVVVAHVLGEKLSNPKKVCDLAQSKLDSGKLSPKGYSAAAFTFLSLKCDNKLKANVATDLASLIEDHSDMESLGWGSVAIARLSKVKAIKFDKADLVPVVEKIVALMEDDGTFKNDEDDEAGSPGSAGLAYHALAAIYNAVDGDMDDSDLEQFISVTETIPNLFLMGDSTEETLEFGSTWNTGLVISGAVGLGKALQTEVDISGEQIGQVANSLLRARTSTDIEDIAVMMFGLRACVDNDVHTPLVVTLGSTTKVEGTEVVHKPKVKIFVTDVFAAKAVDATVSVKATNTLTEDVAFEDESAVVDATDGSKFTLDMKNQKMAPGSYDLEITVTPSGDEKFEETTVVRGYKVFTKITVNSLKVTVKETETEDSTQKNAKKYTAKYPAALSETVRADSNKRVLVTFSVAGADGDSLRPHQVFLKLSHKKEGRDFYFVCKFEDDTFHAEIETNRLDLLDGLDGDYAATLIIGDAFIQNSIVYKLGTFNLDVAGELIPAPVNTRVSKPVIHHTFRAPEKRPAKTVSSAFSMLVLSPVAVLLIGLLRVGANVNGLASASPMRLLFLGCIGAMVFVLFSFWLSWSIFTTLKTLVGLGVVTFLVGHQALRDHANSRKEKTA
eukprot:GFYU01007704.1.p1 GENE.GFYU01007704.1~~GFYU01007704.1.p1  ORF type:complete len:685 (+),score=290.58 GFYU01007704.1:194-2056(+)